MDVAYLVNRVLEVWRPTTTADGSGGQVVTFVRQADVDAKMDQPSATERVVAAQAQSRHSHNIYMVAGAGVERGDELRGGGQVFRVISVVEPSRPVYRKALCELVQVEGG
jgi:head-tail adaptor